VISDSQTMHIPETRLKLNMSMIQAQQCRSGADFRSQGFRPQRSPVRIHLPAGQFVKGVMSRKSAATWESTRESTRIALRACQIAKDATFNVQDYITTKSQMALIAAQQCEKELDQIERPLTSPCLLPSLR
jgi:hypothetical protein